MYLLRLTLGRVREAENLWNGREKPILCLIDLIKGWNYWADDCFSLDETKHRTLVIYGYLPKRITNLRNTCKCEPIVVFM